MIIGIIVSLVYTLCISSNIMKKVYLVTIILTIIIIIIFFLTKHKNNSQLINLIGLHERSDNQISFLNWPVTLQWKTENFQYLEFENEKKSLSILKTLKINPESAFKKIQDLKSQIESLYDPKIDPYFAVITRKIDCPSEFLPKVKKSENENEIKIETELFASERKGLGACSKDSATLLAHVTHLYCKNNESFFEIKYFYPKEDSGHITLSCLP